MLIQQVLPSHDPMPGLGYIELKPSVFSFEHYFAKLYQFIYCLMFLLFSLIFCLRLSELGHVFWSNDWFRNDRALCFPRDTKHDDTLYGRMPQTMTQKAIDIEEIIKTDHVFEMVGLYDVFNVHGLLGHRLQRFKGWLHRSLRLIRQIAKIQHLQSPSPMGVKQVWSLKAMHIEANETDVYSCAAETDKWCLRLNHIESWILCRMIRSTSQAWAWKQLR